MFSYTIQFISCSVSIRTMLLLNAGLYSVEATSSERYVKAVEQRSSPSSTQTAFLPLKRAAFDTVCIWNMVYVHAYCYDLQK